MCKNAFSMNLGCPFLLAALPGRRINRPSSCSLMFSILLVSLATFDGRKLWNSTCELAVELQISCTTASCVRDERCRRRWEKVEKGVGAAIGHICMQAILGILCLLAFYTCCSLAANIPIIFLMFIFISPFIIGLWLIVNCADDTSMSFYQLLNHDDFYFVNYFLIILSQHILIYQNRPEICYSFKQ